ncbi:hypothetical protein ASFV_Kyiv_2016_131_00173 [African swine fever virus]|uniref:Uncharacterized protein n=1 Tax=African swine fever virus TaxID=10497 RepID=A0A5B8XEP7_ASF|nr:hypothetical protein ASFV_Kyiv_2016_131_00173 [African swine fever virus]UUH61848.1 hypothetical protein OAOJGCID_00060 [African swine fever virus]
MAYPELDAADFLQQLARRKEFKSLISPPVDQKELIRDLRAHFVQIGGPGCEKGGERFFRVTPTRRPFLPSRVSNCIMPSFSSKTFKIPTRPTRVFY